MRLTVLPQVNNLVEPSQLCGPVAQQHGVLGSQMKLFLEEVFSKYNAELSVLRQTIFIKIYTNYIFSEPPLLRARNFPTSLGTKL